MRSLRKYVVERDVAGIGAVDRNTIGETARKSNAALEELAPDIHWLQTFVTADKLFCLYLAKNEAVIRRHAERSGLAVSRITEVLRTIDPSTALD
jgi:hypothetical protein